MANPRDPLLSFHLCWTQRNNPKSSGSSKYNPTVNQRDFNCWYEFLSHLDHIEVNLPVVASPAWYEPVPILLLLKIQMRPALTFRNKNLLRWIDWGELPPGHPRLKKNQIIVQTKKKQDDRRRRSESGTEVNGSLFWLGGVPIVDDGPPRPFLHTYYGLQATYWHESGFWAERSTWVWGDASQTLNPFLFLPSRPQDQSDTGTSSTLQFSADPQPIQLIFIPFFNNSACLKLHKSFSFTTITPRKFFLTEILSLCTSPIAQCAYKGGARRSC